MDSWSADQLKKMQKGGNNKLNSFLKTYGIEKHQDITTKYNSEAAQVCMGMTHKLLLSVAVRTCVAVERAYGVGVECGCAWLS